jgi:hypothetical protein
MQSAIVGRKSVYVQAVKGAIFMELQTIVYRHDAENDVHHYQFLKSTRQVVDEYFRHLVSVIETVEGEKSKVTLRLIFDSSKSGLLPVNDPVASYGACSSTTCPC